MGVYDDGPYEVGYEKLLNPDLVQLPANSYLGECLPTEYIYLTDFDFSFPSSFLALLTILKTLVCKNHTIRRVVWSYLLLF